MKPFTWPTNVRLRLPTVGSLSRCQILIGSGAVRRLYAFGSALSCATKAPKVGVGFTKAETPHDANR